MSSLDSLVSAALADFAAAGDPAALENAKARYLGKAGLLTVQLKALGALAPDARRDAGARINEAKSRLESALDARRASHRPRRSTSRCRDAVPVRAACTR